MRKFYSGSLLVLAVAAIVAITAVVTSGSFLVLNQPRKSDVIVVLAGEAERRPARGFELLSENFAPRLLLDVPVYPTIYQSSLLELAQKYLDRQPQTSATSLCPIYARSTKGEAQDVSLCLEKFNAHTVLLVTSEFHTRRALSIFKHVCPQFEFSIAAAYDSRQFGARWWRHRQWAKINFDEWVRLVWWELVDRWR